MGCNQHALIGNSVDNLTNVPEQLNCIYNNSMYNRTIIYRVYPKTLDKAKRLKQCLGADSVRMELFLGRKPENDGTTPSRRVETSTEDDVLFVRQGTYPTAS